MGQLYDDPMCSSLAIKNKISAWYNELTNSNYDLSPLESYEINSTNYDLIDIVDDFLNNVQTPSLSWCQDAESALQTSLDDSLDTEGYDWRFWLIFLIIFWLIRYLLILQL